MIGIKDIWIEAENWAEGEWNYENGNTDVIITLENNKKHIATFFTYKNIQSLTTKYKESGECLNGKYFWASDMVLIDNCSRKSIERIIIHMLKSDEFNSIFEPIDTKQSK